MSLVSKIMGSHSEREIKRIMPLVDQIEGLEEEMRAKSDEELRAKTTEFKERLAAGETLDDIPVQGAVDRRHHSSSGTHLRDENR